MKRVTSLVILLLLLSAGIIPSFGASEEARIYADNLSVGKGESQLIYLNIKNNPGIMGFKIHLAYIDEYVKINKIVKGDVNKPGNLTTNLGLKKGGVDMVWSNTEPISEDGTIAVISVTVLTDEPFAIYSSYSEADTFDGNFKSVRLKCGTIYSKNTETDTDVPDNISETPNEQGTVTESHKPELNDEIAEIIVAETVENGQVKSFDDLDQKSKDELLNTVNDRINNEFGVENRYTDFSQLEQDYKNSLKKELFNDIAVLQPDLNEEQVVLDYLEEKKSGRFNTNQAVDFIDKLEEKGLEKKYGNFLTDEEIKDELNNYVKNNTVTTRKGVGGYIVILLSVILLCTITIVLIKHIKTKRKGGNEIE